MGPVEINGLPAHVLLVHLTIVLIPTAALCVVLSAWWPRARRWLGVLTPIACLAALAMVPVTTNAGDWLRDQLGGGTPLVARHEELGNLMLGWSIAVAVAGVGQWAWHRWYADGAGASAAEDGERRDVGNERTTIGARVTVVSVVIGLIASAAAVGSVVHVVRVGDSGARAVWDGTVSTD